MVLVVVTFRWWQDVFITIRSYRICLCQVINTFLIRHAIGSGHAVYFTAKIKALRCEWQPLFPAIRGHVFPFSNQYCVYFNCVTFSLRVIQAFTINIPLITALLQSKEGKMIRNSFNVQNWNHLNNKTFRKVYRVYYNLSKSDCLLWLFSLKPSSCLWGRRRLAFCRC